MYFKNSTLEKVFKIVSKDFSENTVFKLDFYYITIYDENQGGGL